MQIQINFGDIQNSNAVEEHVSQCLEKALEHVSDRVTRVEVHLRDDKQGRDGHDDKRCTMEVRLAGEQPMAVESRSSDIYHSITETAEKLGRAVGHKIDRKREF